MSVKDIIAKIEKEGQEEIKKLKAHYDTRVKEIGKIQEKEKKAFFDIEMKKINKEVEEVTRGIILSAKLEKRKKILRAKRESINQVFNFVIDDLKGLAGKDSYYKFLKEYAIKLCEDKDVVYLAKSDVKDFKDKLSKDVKKKITIKEGKLKGGMIIERGKINYNLSVESIIEKRMEELEKTVGMKLNVL